MGLAARSFAKGTPEYEEAHRAVSWNARLPDRYPERIVLARDATDVVEAVRYARAAGLAVAARSGGHSWTASAIRNGSILIDLSAMDSVDYRPGDQVAVVEPGVHGKALNTMLAPHGLFFPSGHCSTVAIGGFLLQGGWGWNSRSIGPACLSVEAVHVVTADGDLIRASREQNQDLWWAARGAGPGYFGIVTAFHVRLHRRPAVMQRSFYVYPLELRAEVLGWAHEVGPRLPPELEFVLLATTPRGPDGEAVADGTALLVNGHALMDDADSATTRWRCSTPARSPTCSRRSRARSPTCSGIPGCGRSSRTPRSRSRGTSTWPPTPARPLAGERAAAGGSPRSPRSRRPLPQLPGRRRRLTRRGATARQIDRSQRRIEWEVSGRPTRAGSRS